MSEEEVKKLLKDDYEEFIHWMRGQTVWADDNGKTVFPERDVRRFQTLKKRERGKK